MNSTHFSTLLKRALSKLLIYDVFHLKTLYFSKISKWGKLCELIKLNVIWYYYVSFSSNDTQVIGLNKWINKPKTKIAILRDNSDSLILWEYINRKCEWNKKWDKTKMNNEQSKDDNIENSICSIVEVLLKYIQKNEEKQFWHKKSHKIFGLSTTFILLLRLKNLSN